MSWPPAIAGLLALALWQGAVWATGVPAYLVAGPIAIVQAFLAAPGFLLLSLASTLVVTFTALAVSTVLGVALAIAITASRWARAAIEPWAVALQVTPIVAIAPLIIIWTNNNIPLSLFICAWIGAFFPILANTVVGLRSADPNLEDLFRLYEASPWQRLRFLLVPSALPYFLAGLKIAGGLALVGAVVAEFAAGTSGAQSGLAYRILEASFRLNVPRMFAALVLVSVCGILIFFAFNLLAKTLLGKWHESEMRPER